jgi:hypothetical protein
MRIYIEGGNLKTSAPRGSLTRELRADILRNKDALMGLLCAEAMVPARELTERSSSSELGLLEFELIEDKPSEIPYFELLPDGGEMVVETRVKAELARSEQIPIAGLKPKTNNHACVAGFVLGLTSVFLYVIGILPIMGILINIIGLASFDKSTQKNKWMGVVGLILSGLYSLMYLNHYGHFR